MVANSENAREKALWDITPDMSRYMPTLCQPVTAPRWDVDGVSREESPRPIEIARGCLADLLGLMRLRRHNREPFYSLEVAVAADENSA